MSAKQTTLNDLPVELLQRTASFLPCKTALNLFRVNKLIYEACYDRQVFESIIENRNACDGPLWTTIPLSNDSPTSAWARYAVVDLRAGQWHPEDYENLNFVMDFVRWAPQIMAATRKSSVFHIFCVS